MTAYVAIADSDIDPESPGTATLFTRMRDNPIAITEGTSPAPQMQTAAYTNLSVTLAKMAANSVDSSKLVSTERMTNVNVGNAIAGIGSGSIGSSVYCAHNTVNTAINENATYAGSLLRPAGVYGVSGSSGFISVLTSTSYGGTWRAMGDSVSAPGNKASTLFKRIS